MRRLVLVGLASPSIVLLGGILAGCGDNRAKSSAGTPDADAAVDRVDAGDGGDATDVRDAVDGDASGEVGDGGVCQMVTFTDPMNNAMLGAADDASGDACANGFQYTVRVGIAGANGASVELRGTTGATTTTLGTATVAAGQAQFMNVTLPQGSTTLTVRMTGSTTACTTSAMIMVNCALPIVTIIAPLSDTPPFADRAKHLLAATSTQAFKDLNATMAGAQTNVVACTNKLGSARLFAGQMGDPMLTQVGAAVTAVAAVPADNCPMGLSFVARFPGVTLPESDDNADGTLDQATEISVSVTDAAAPSVTGNSDPTNLWVDSVAPTITERSPVPFCGSMQNAVGTFTTTVTFNSSVAGVTLSVTNNNSPTPVTFGPPTFAAGVATFTNVAFPPSQNIVIATATEPSGNVTNLTPPTGMPVCTVTVGQAPVVTFVAPTMGSKLCAVGNSANGCLPDSNMAVPGWQNPVTVHVTSAGAPLTTGTVTFVINMGAPQVITLDASGNATIPLATIPEGMAVPVTATTNNVAGAGIGTASLTFQVDTLPPAAPTALTVVPLDRRQTSFTLGWTAPLDQGQPTVAAYDIHVKKLDPMTMDACGTEVRAVPFVGTPKAATMLESVPATGLSIETDYCFTVSASDPVGNVGPTVTAMGRADFNATTLMVTDSATQVFGNVMDGSGDFGSPALTAGFANDGLSDLIVGPINGQAAYLYFGRLAGYGPGPDVVFRGPASRRFGAGVVNAGDLDGDGLTDIAIGAPGLTATDPAAVYIFSRKNASWVVNGGWPATLDYTQASYVISADATYGGSQFAVTMARMGNFDGAGRDDLALGATSYDMGPSGTNGGRVVVVKGSDTFASINLPDMTNTIVLDGEASNDQLGRGIEVLADGAFVVSAHNAMTGAGKLYAFRSPLAPMVVANAASAADITVYGSSNGQYGFAISTLGPLGLSLAVVTASATGAGGNFVDVHIGSATDGPFGGAEGSAPMPSVRFTSSTTGNSVGIVNIGSMTSGSTAGGSFIGGDAIPDLVIAGQADPTNAIYIVSGAAIPSFAGTVDLASTTTAGVVTIRNKVPTGWTSYGRGSFIVDLDGNGYSDIAIAESGSNKPGRALILW